MSKAVLTALLERSTCPYQRSLLSFSMRSRSSIHSRANSSVDLMVAVSCGLTLQICLIITLSFRCGRKRQDFVTGQVSLAWSIALRTHELYTLPSVLKERWREERTGFKLLLNNLFVWMDDLRFFLLINVKMPTMSRKNAELSMEKVL